MIEKAVALVNDCDILVVVGTSLQVYPAASLLHYAPRFLPKYIIDKKIPPVQSSPTLHLIEKPATEGIKKLQQILLKDK